MNWQRRNGRSRGRYETVIRSAVTGNPSRLLISNCLFEMMRVHDVGLSTMGRRRRVRRSFRRDAALRCVATQAGSHSASRRSIHVHVHVQDHLVVVNASRRALHVAYFIPDWTISLFSCVRRMSSTCSYLLDQFLHLLVVFRNTCGCSAWPF